MHTILINFIEFVLFLIAYRTIYATLIEFLHYAPPT